MGNNFSNLDRGLTPSLEFCVTKSPELMLVSIQEGGAVDPVRPLEMEGTTVFTTSVRTSTCFLLETSVLLAVKC